MPHSAMSAYPLPWIEPLDLAAACDDTCTVLLYSAMAAEGKPRVSLLARKPLEIIDSGGWAALERVLSVDRPTYENAWFGYLGYGMKDELERYQQDEPPLLPFPDMWLARFGEIYRFEHDTRRLTCFAAAPPAHARTPRVYDSRTTALSLQSNMTRDEYLQGVYSLLDGIGSGALYQANLTRKFYGELSEAPNYLGVFDALCARSPAPYAAYIRMDAQAIISSSPECFLEIDAAGRALTRPIKGSAARHSNPQADAQARTSLLENPKERAENLMIVDLMRNDLARAAIPGSVKVECLYDITSYATVHHLSSTVSAQLSQSATPLSLVKACFPPGSMTGAPKISAVRRCTELERVSRGVYSGALGWFGGDGYTHLSVVIRTILLNNLCFEFQVGGGIVFDSNPKAEWQETLLKARALCDVLGIAPEAIAAL